MPLHVFFIVMDDWGFNMWGGGGHATVSTPNLDALATGGRVYDNFCAVSPVCSPSRAGYWTGRYPQFSGVHYTDSRFWSNRYHVPEGMRTYASELSASGVYCTHYGKTNLGYPPRCGYPTKLGHNRWTGHSIFDSLTNFYWVDVEGDANPGVVNHSNVSGYAPDDLWFDTCASRIAGLAGQNTLDVLWGGLPHEPLNTINLAEEADYAGMGLTAQQIKHFAAISHVDAGIGRLVAAIDAAGIRADSTIIVTSDQGPEPDNGGTTDGLRGWKTHLTEGGVRVPLICNGPGFTAGSTDSVARNGLDLLPTFLGIFSVDASDFPGVSLLDTPSARTLFAEYHGPTRSPQEGGSATAKRGDLKLHYDEGGGGGYTLYDLSSDPGEETDIFDTGTAAHTDLRDELIAWLATLPEESPTGSATTWDDSVSEFAPNPVHVPRIADGEISALLNKLLALPATGGNCAHGVALPDRNAYGTGTATHNALGHTGTVVHEGILESAQDSTNRARLTSGELDTLDDALLGAVQQVPTHTSIP